MKPLNNKKPFQNQDFYSGTNPQPKNPNEKKPLSNRFGADAFKPDPPAQKKNKTRYQGLL